MQRKRDVRSNESGDRFQFLMNELMIGLGGANKDCTKIENLDFFFEKGGWKSNHEIESQMKRLFQSEHLKEQSLDLSFPTLQIILIQKRSRH